MQSVRIILSAILVVALSVAVAWPAPQVDNGIQTLTDYFDYLVSGNLESAGLTWTQAAQERSSRFGITYTGIPLRVDCTSPITRNVEKMRMYLRPACRQAQVLAGDNVKLEYNNIVDGKLVKWYYYAHLEGGYYWLTYAQDCYTQDWPVKESRYFRIHAHPDKKQYLNPAVLEESDRFVDRICDSLKLDKATRAELATKKIEYFLCDNTETVNNITGETTRGLLDLASNDIISSDFPHFHEVVHLLVNIKLKTLPLMTIPLLREGTAVRYGGRWGKRPSALMDLGAYLCKQKLVEIDSILTTTGFNSASGADIAYPVAGDFCSYLYQRLGAPKFFALYLDLSRSDDALDTLSAAVVEKEIIASLGKSDWGAAMTDFDSFLNDAVPLMAMARSGKADKGKEILNVSHFKVTQDNDWLNFEFTCDSSVTQGSIFFAKDPRFGAAPSYLWDEQFGGAYPFEGYRFGVRVDQNEAGLYDYATNELIAKYIFGISAGDGYFDQAAGKIYIRFRNSLVGKDIPIAESFRFIPK